MERELAVVLVNSGRLVLDGGTGFKVMDVVVVAVTALKEGSKNRCRRTSEQHFSSSMDVSCFEYRILF